MLTGQDWWDEFYKKVEKDHRIGPSHLGLYMALLYCNSIEGGSTLRLDRKKIMRFSLIRSRHTYSQCLRDLHSGGYIIYLPSCHAKVGSRVQIKIKE